METKKKQVTRLGEFNRDERLKFNTNSILKFLKENMDLLYEYLDNCEKDCIYPNYSHFLKRVSGFTSDNVDLRSGLVDRSCITKFMRLVQKARNK